MGSSTFFTIPAAVYLSRASFSLIGLATGTQCTGENFYLELNWGSQAAKAFDVFRICLSMSSYVNFPVKPCVLERITMGLEGKGVAGSPYGLSLLGCSGWQHFTSLGVLLV